MSEHVVLDVEHQSNPSSPVKHEEKALSSLALDTGEQEQSNALDKESAACPNVEEDMSLPAADCRICQEEDLIVNLESPCACTGSLKFAHRKCVQHWCNEKGDTVCEICRKPYEGGYTTPNVVQDSISINVGANWDISSSQQFDMHEPRLFAVAAERPFFEGDYDDYARANARSAACFRSFALILMALLLFRHFLSMTVSGTDEDASTFFLLFVLRAAGFLLPCYIMARAMSVLQSRRQHEEASLAAAEVAYILQAGQTRGVHFAVPPVLSS